MNPKEPNEHPYLMFVEWSPEDQIFIGYCPELFVGGVCHDENRAAAYIKLSKIVENDIRHTIAQRDELPRPKHLAEILS
jgi:hypothetical protein